MAGFVVLAILGAATFAIWRSGRRLSDKPPTIVKRQPSDDYQPPTFEGYVGSDACAECHGAIAESFKAHPMSRSIRRVDVQSDPAVLHSSQTPVAGRQRILDVDNEDGRMRHHERMYDDQGELIYDQAVPIDYVVGSGRRAQAYLSQRGSLLFMSPLNWYTQSQRWDLAPGYAKDDARRFDRRVTDECLSCHSGRVAAEGRSLNRYERPAFHEMSIGCENCHGPGQRHVDFHKSEFPPGDADTIVNPARLDPSRRESVCNQCHLQAAVRVSRFGRSDFDFRPGRPLVEIWTVFDKHSGVTGDGQSRAVSHVQQMHESRCYLSSEGRFGCTSCHDPHSIPSADDRVGFYRGRCLKCHQESSCSQAPELRSENGDSCVACHMPARPASNVSHVTQTDHRVLRAAAQAGEHEHYDDPDSLSFFDHADRNLEAWERERALGLAAWKHLSKLGRPRPLELLQFFGRALATHPADGTVLTAAGSIASDNQHADDARDYFERARKLPESEEAALSGLLDIYFLASENEKALGCAERLIEIDPGDARVHALRADILLRAGNTSQAIDAAKLALDFNPTLIPIRQWLVEACKHSGREAEAIEQEQIIRRMRSARRPR